MSLGNERVSRKKRFSEIQEISAFTSTAFDPEGLTVPETAFRKKARSETSILGQNAEGVGGVLGSEKSAVL